MAKRRRKKTKTSNKLDSTAAGIGKTLGQVMARVDAVKKQRDTVVEELREVARVAQNMMVELGADLATAGRSARKTVRKATTSVTKKRQKRKRKMSKEGRAAISAAAKKRWAKVRAQQK